jgi:hypothetical protein
MSTVLAATYITVHLFGLTSKDFSNTPFGSFQQCVNHLEIKTTQAKRNPNNQVSFNPANGKAAISNKQTYEVAAYECINQGKS